MQTSLHGCITEIVKYPSVCPCCSDTSSEFKKKTIENSNLVGRIISYAYATYGTIFEQKCQRSRSEGHIMIRLMIDMVVQMH